MGLPSIEQLQAKILVLEQQMSDPSKSRDVQRMKSLTREHLEAKNLFELLAKLNRVQTELSDAKQLETSADQELVEMAREDVLRLTAEELTLIASIEGSMIPSDPRDERNVILEIRAGAGGDEATLFAAEIFRAYARYGEVNGWRVHTVNSSKSEQGGFKEIIAEIQGKKVFGTLKFERGVHRVQRIPSTEKQGRIHTSTITIAVLPQAEEFDIEVRPEDLRIDTYRASGAGGQHVNKTSSAIRITHIPTNTVVAVQDERSQHKNKDKAMSILRARLLEAQEEKRQTKEASERKSQIGTGDRSEKIRTYNYPQDRITDHRIKKSWSNIPVIMNGELGIIFNDLAAAQRALVLKKQF